MSIKVDCYPYGLLGENTYLITDDATGYKAVIDPGYYGVDIRMDIQNNAYLKYILLTHGHYDHFAAIEQYLNEYTNVIFAAPKNEDRLLYHSNTNAMIAGGKSSGKCPDAKLLVSDGDIIKLGATDIEIIATPGHSEGGVCYKAGNFLFSGDTLFRLSVGNTSFETGDWSTLVDSVRNKLYVLEDETIVYPGHGDETTIGYEKRANPFV